MFRSAVLALAALVGAAPVQAAIVVSVNAAGSTSANLSGYTFGVADLDDLSNGPTSFNFVGSPITGATTDGYINISSANVFGGVGGAGQFGTVNGNPATIQLSQSVNYFGLWGSALDGNNSVALYNDNTLLGTYALQSILQSSSGFNSGYYGNPTGGGNSGELYAFFNFASDSAFNRVQLIQNGGGGFEFDNLTVGTAVVSTAPEPATWAMFLIGFGLVGGLLRQRRDGEPASSLAI